MTVLVTGGAGYIGSHMVHALIDAGERVVVLVLTSENEGLIFGHAVSGFAVMVHRKGFAMVALK
jgi:nucleoside-diphosphate-sugar epimerase